VKGAKSGWSVICLFPKPEQPKTVDNHAAIGVVVGQFRYGDRAGLELIIAERREIEWGCLGAFVHG